MSVRTERGAADAIVGPGLTQWGSGSAAESVSQGNHHYFPEAGQIIILAGHHPPGFIESLVACIGKSVIQSSRTEPREDEWEPASGLRILHFLQ